METSAAKITAVEFKPLTTTREERGRQIARMGKIRKLGGMWLVPSQSPDANAPTYIVDVVEQTCTCPDALSISKGATKPKRRKLAWSSGKSCRLGLRSAS
jgi:hypothetical protein